MPTLYTLQDYRLKKYDALTKALIARAEKVGVISERFTQADLDMLATACAKASNEACAIVHYAEALQYASPVGLKRYGRASAFDFLYWLAAQPVITDRRSEFGMLPARARDICEALAFGCSACGQLANFSLYPKARIAHTYCLSCAWQVCHKIKPEIAETIERQNGCNPTERMREEREKRGVVTDYSLSNSVSVRPQGSIDWRDLDGACVWLHSDGYYVTAKAEIVTYQPEDSFTALHTLPTLRRNASEFPKQSEAAQPVYKYAKPSSIDCVAQGSLNGARINKAEAWKRLQSLRSQQREAGLHRAQFTIPIMRAQESHREAADLEAECLAAIEREANKQGLTTTKPKKGSVANAR